MAETNNADNRLFGKKIYFLCTNYILDSNIVTPLREMEYEVYVISNYKNAKNILRHNKDSICFINIDSRFAQKFWINFISSFSSDEVLSTISIGLITEKIKPEQKESFFKLENIKAGITEISSMPAGALKSIVEYLDSVNAKGRRQYVRAICSNKKFTSLFIYKNQKMYDLKLMDISAVGAACKVPLNLKDVVQPKEILSGGTLKLDKIQFSIDSVVYAIHVKEDCAVIVLLFVGNMPTNTKSSIKKFIVEILQEQMMDSIAGEPSDDTDYK